MSSSKKPSLYARKLLDKLRTLHSNTSVESRQTLANWMVFNRKKAEGMAEGMLLAVNSTTSTTSVADGQPQEEPSARLMLLLRILHQVFIEGKDDSDAFQKSAQLRSILADVALIPLLQALATTTAAAAASEQRENYHVQVKEMIDQWKEYSVFDGPTVWEGYKKAWVRAVQDAANANTTTNKKDEGEGNDSIMEDASPAVQTASATTNDAPLDVEMKGEQSSTMENGAQENQSASPTKEETMDYSNTDGSLQKNEEEDDATKKEATTVTESTPPTTTTKAQLAADNATKEEAQDSPTQSKQSPKRDSMTSVTSSIEIDFDAEGVEEAEVEPAKFLEASKVIASLQIARGTSF